MTGHDLQRIRALLELTQEELGARLGVQKNTVWRWEHDQRRIPEPVARLVDYLVKEVKQEKKPITKRKA